MREKCNRCRGTQDVRLYMVSYPKAATSVENLCCKWLPNMITDGFQFTRIFDKPKAADPFAGERFRLVNRESGAGDQTPPR